MCPIIKSMKIAAICRCEILIGDLQSEEGRDIVLFLSLPVSDTPKQECVLKATLVYFNVITSIMQTTSHDLVVNRTGTHSYPLTYSFYLS